MSLFTASLFNRGRYPSGGEATCNDAPDIRYRNLFLGGVGYHTSIDSTASTNDNVVSTTRDLMRWKVVNENDAHRGFRMFDGILMSVKDVSSEELFLERMKIAYSAYDAYVSRLINGSPLDITKALVRAVSACLTKYFSTQSLLRTNRPFIAKVLNLDCPDMFCTHSDFMRSFLFTNASPEDEAIISLAERVYDESSFDVCGDVSTDLNARPGNNTEDIFERGLRLVERHVLGGTNTSYSSLRSGGEAASHFAGLSDELPFQERKDGVGRPLDGGTTAMLITVTDFEALHNYVAYVLYLTPAQLSRRYNINFDCLQRPAMSSKVGLECCRARESRKRKRDETKVVIRTVIEKKRREKIDAMVERSSTCEATLQQRATQISQRNNDLLCHVLLMLFDKCLSGLIDKGFENLNARRGYAVNSAKEIGTATIYTGIIDTVGEVSSNVESYTFENIVKNGTADTEPSDPAKQSDEDNQARLHFTLPLNSIIGAADKELSRGRSLERRNDGERDEEN